MNVETRELPGCQVEIDLALDAAEVQKYFDKVYRELNSRGQIHGFRAGKAPRAIITRHFGKDAIRNSVWYEIVSEQLEKVSEDLDIVGQPELPEPEDMNIVEGEPVAFTIKASTGPRVSLGDLSDITLIRPATAPTEEDIAQVINDLKDTHAVETARPEGEAVVSGDAVDFEMSVTVEDAEEPVEAQTTTVIVGRDQMFPPMDAELIGKIVGDVVEMDETYPDDYHDEKLAGQLAHFSAKITAIRSRELPELDDALAQKVDAEQFPTYDALYAEIVRQLTAQREKYSREELESQITKELFERCEVELPEFMVENLAQRERAGLMAEFQRAGMNFSEFQESTGMSEDDLMVSQRSRARHLLEFSEIMDAIANRDALEITDEDMAPIIDDYAAESRLDANVIKQALQLTPEFAEQMTSRARRRKVFETIINNATLQDMPAEEYLKIRDSLLKLEEEETEATEEEVAEIVADETAEVVAEDAAEVVADEAAEDAPAVDEKA